MKIQDEWRMFDPTDARTHPEGIADVEMEFEDGRKIEGFYSRELGIFTDLSGGPRDKKPRRWRYLEAAPDAIQ